jgi:dienelactone hydrolase
MFLLARIGEQADHRGPGAVAIPPLGLRGTLTVPVAARGLVVFAHGSGSSHQSPRNVAVADALVQSGFATLLFDLLTPDEEGDRGKVFDIPLLADRLMHAVHWINQRSDLSGLPLGFFGASTGAAAALVAAAHLGERVAAVVSRGGRPDLAQRALDAVRAPVLLIVGGQDVEVLALNERALARLRGEKSLAIVPGATHLFPESGALEAVVRYAAEWFTRHLGDADGATGGPHAVS